MGVSAAAVDLDAVRANVRALLGSLAPGAGLMAVVKANGYGHGAVPVARAALQAGARWLGVAHVDEGLVLRRAGVRAPVLVLVPAPPADLDRALAAGLSLTVCSREHAEAAAARARAAGVTARLHLKVDTGMGRLGADPAQAPDLVRAIRALPGAELEGLFSHFATADEPDLSFARSQLEAFQGLVSGLAATGLRPALCHMANTAAILNLPSSHLDLVRAGIGVYGIYPSPHVARRVPLRPALSWSTRIAFVKEVSPGTSLSYGRTYIARGVRRIATLPVGYGDGYPRVLSNRGRVLVHGRRVPVVGRVCMNLTLVDVTGVPGVREGDEAVLLGRQDGEEITADELAALARTIPYEITCGIGRNAPLRHLNP